MKVASEVTKADQVQDENQDDEVKDEPVEKNPSEEEMALLTAKPKMTARQKTPEDSGRNAEEVVLTRTTMPNGHGSRNPFASTSQTEEEKNSGLRDALSCILSSTKRWKQIDKLSVHKAA